MGYREIPGGNHHPLSTACVAMPGASAAALQPPLSARELNRYEAVRIERTTRIVNGSAETGRRFHNPTLADPAAAIALALSKLASPDRFLRYAARVALEAIRRTGTKDRRAIADAALAIRDFDGALGHWGFDENGDTTMRTLTVSVVKNGRFEFEEVIDASVADDAPAESPPP